MEITASIDSIIFYVQDVQRLKSFYTGFFGMTIIEEFSQLWVLLKAGDINLGLHRSVSSTGIKAVRFLRLKTT